MNSIYMIKPTFCLNPILQSQKDCGCHVWRKAGGCMWIRRGTVPDSNSIVSIVNMLPDHSVRLLH